MMLELLQLVSPADLAEVMFNYGVYGFLAISLVAHIFQWRHVREVEKQRVEDEKEHIREMARLNTEFRQAQADIHRESRIILEDRIRELTSALTSASRN